MKAKIGNRLLASITPGSKPFQIHDTELRGFILRVQPSGELTYLVFSRMKNGKRVRITLGRASQGLSPQQARDLATEKLADIMKGVDPSQRAKADAFTLRQFVEEKFSPWAETNLGTAAETQKRVLAVFEELLDERLSKINAWTVEKWRSGRLKAGLSKATVNRDITALKSVFALAVRQNTLSSNPLADVKAKKTDPWGIVRYLAPNEESNLRAQLDAREERIRGERDRGNEWRSERGYPLLPDLRGVLFADYLKPLVLISLNTGMRRGELLKLRWEVIDFAARISSVVGATAKSGRTRHIPLNDEALQALQAWNEQNGCPTSGWVFLGENGDRLKDVKKSWTAVLAAAGIANFRFHDLRHHFASRLVMAGVDLNTVRELLGHADIKMTLRYAHLAPHVKANAVARLMSNTATAHSGDGFRFAVSHDSVDSAAEVGAPL